jgi:hypothetical protein
VLERSNSQLVEAQHESLAAGSAPFEVVELFRDYGNLLNPTIAAASTLSARLGTAIFDGLLQSVSDDSLGRHLSSYREPLELLLDDRVFGALRRLQALVGAARSDDFDQVVLLFDRGTTFKPFLESLLGKIPSEKVFVAMPNAAFSARSRFGKILGEIRSGHGSLAKGPPPIARMSGPTRPIENQSSIRTADTLMLAPFGERKYGPIARALLNEIGQQSNTLIVDAVGTLESAKEVADVVGTDALSIDVWTISDLLTNNTDAPPDIEVAVNLQNYHGELGAAAIELSLTCATLQSFLDPIIEKALQTEFWQLTRLAHSAEYLLKSRAVRVGFVMSSRLPPILTVIEAARRLGIPTIEPQSVLYGRGVARQKAPAGDYICAIDTYAHELFEEYYGVEGSRIVVAGSTRIDDFKRAFDRT